MADEPELDGDEHAMRWAASERDRCEQAIDPHVRCMRVRGHDGLHAWRSERGERTFEWG